MDDIGLYKGKLKEALNIFPTMSEEKKWEAVTYWNDVAMQFQRMVATVETSSNLSEENTAMNPGPAAGGDSTGLHMAANRNGETIGNQSCVEGGQHPTSPSTDNEARVTAALTEQMNEIMIQPESKSPSRTESSMVLSTMNKRFNVPLDAPLELDNIILEDSLCCPRTMADVADEIGNGQFDRGPARSQVAEPIGTYVVSANSLSSPSGVRIDDSHFGSCQDHANADGMIVGLSERDCPSQASVIPNFQRQTDNYTHSDRPLQQIQPFDASGNHQDNIFQNSNPWPDRVKSWVCSGDNSCMTGYHISYSASPDDRSSNYDHAFSSLDGQALLGDASSTDLEQIVDIKRELIVDSELYEFTVANGCSSVGSNSSSGSNLEQRQQHMCNVCGKSGFSTKGNLKRHLRAHSGEKPFKCDYCDSCFTEKKSLKIHVRRHTGEKPYKCNVCGKLFSQTGVLQSHMALHLNERKFECQKCGKAFRQRSQLKLHLMRHDGVKRLQCQTCNARFLTKGDLERHFRIHTGEKPYRCELCGKTFTRQQSLNEHMNRHTGNKPYYCKFCDKKFSEMSACYKHTKTHKQIQQQQMVLQTV